MPRKIVNYSFAGGCADPCGPAPVPEVPDRVGHQPGQQRRRRRTRAAAGAAAASRLSPRSRWRGGCLDLSLLYPASLVDSKRRRPGVSPQLARRPLRICSGSFLLSRLDASRSRSAGKAAGKIPNKKAWRNDRQAAAGRRGLLSPAGLLSSSFLYPLYFIAERIRQGYSLQIVDRPFL